MRGSRRSGRRSVVGGVAALSARRPVAVIVLWLSMAAAAVLGGLTAGGGFSDDFELPGSQAAEGMALVSESDGGARWSSAQVVVHAPSGELTDHRAEIDESLGAVEDLDFVAAVSDPWAGPAVEPGMSTALVTVELAVAVRDMAEADVDLLRAAFQPATDAGLQVEYAGTLGERMDGRERSSTEALGLLGALLVLLVVFRSVAGAVLPVAGALVAVALGVGVLGLAAAWLDFPSASVALALMIGLGTGIDYGLLLVTRSRQLIADGVAPRVAAARAAESSGHAVVVGALTVTVALLALFASGVPFVGRLGVAAAITVVSSMLAALTLVPALIGLTGRRIDRLSFGTPRAEPVGPLAPGGRAPGWIRYARFVARRPWPFLGAAAVLLAVLSAPLVALDTGPLDEGAGSTERTDRRAYDLIASELGPGANGPLVVVLDAEDLSAEAAESWAQSVADALAAEPGVAEATPPAPVGDSATWVSTVTPRFSPDDQRTADLVDRLRDDVLPETWDGESGASPAAYVTGYTAAHVEFGQILAARLPWIIGLVLLASMVVLTFAFRSPVVAIKAALLNMVSIGAAYGVLVAVFQWQWGSQLVGLDRAVPIETYVPMLMFVIVFGLSMDYEVFLLSRVRERWLATGDNGRAVEEGLAATGRVISAAALIMIGVFLGFTADVDVAVRMLAVGLAVSVAVDASIVRLVLVPAAMAVMGRLNWWLPRRWARPPAAVSDPSADAQPDRRVGAPRSASDERTSP